MCITGLHTSNNIKQTRYPQLSISPLLGLKILWPFTFPVDMLQHLVLFWLNLLHTDYKLFTIFSSSMRGEWISHNHWQDICRWYDFLCLQFYMGHPCHLTYFIIGDQSAVDEYVMNESTWGHCSFLSVSLVPFIILQKYYKVLNHFLSLNFKSNKATKQLKCSSSNTWNAFNRVFSWYQIHLKSITTWINVTTTEPLSPSNLTGSDVCML